ncbi:hypothetical protein L208DRAFT_1375062 [Tricholoma matsutake]|nr:hypothetical protein L208DRAFT_1375062 [Tricholoma matsutake 945]
MTALWKTGLNLLNKMRAEWKALEEMGIQPIGVAGDAAGDGGKMRRLLKAEKPQALIADCWTHQVPLMLGNYYKRNPKVATLVDQAIKVIKWFNNHSYCLGKLRDEQIITYEWAWALIMPIITCWTSHFCLLSQILQFLEYVGSSWKKIETAE